VAALFAVLPEESPRSSGRAGPLVGGRFVFGSHLDSPAITLQPAERGIDRAAGQTLISIMSSPKQ